MKSIISVLLCFLMLLPVFSVVNAEEKYVIPEDPEIPGTASLGELSLPTGSKRSVKEDNLLIPGSLVRDLAVKAGSSVHFDFLAYQSGKANQYGCILIYRGRGTDGDLIYTDYSRFGTEVGFSTMRFNWDCQKEAPGTYTVVCVTAEPYENNLLFVKDTANLAYVHITESWVSPDTFYLEDMETGKQLDTIHVSVDQVKLLLWDSAPKPSYGLDHINADIGEEIISSFDYRNQIADVQYEAGIFIITPKRTGHGILRFTYRNVDYEFPVNICVSDQGHKYTQTVKASKPMINGAGVNIHYCTRCYCYIRETTPSAMETLRNFKDVDDNAWYYEYVRRAVFRNLFQGISKTQFKPYNTMTRGMLVTVLWRFAGEPEAEGMTFSDVNPKEWYGKAVEWASEQEIVNGVGKGKFDPNGTVTREQLGTILYRYAQKLGIGTSEKQNLDSFEDASSVSSWAIDPIQWAVSYGLITGSSEGNKLYLLPQDGASRAQVSAMLIRFVEKYEQFLLLPVTLDPNGAVESGSVEYFGKTLTWAYYEDGTLRFAGDSHSIPCGGEDPDKYLWHKYREEVKRIEILGPVKSINESAFAEYVSLESLWMGDTVEYIFEEAFANCGKLKTVRFSEKLTTIKYGAFRNCFSLTDITLPDSLEHIGGRAFENCTSLNEIILPSNILKHYLGGNNADTSRTMGTYVFSGCTSLERVVLPIAMTDIPDYTFANCTSLKFVELPLCIYDLGVGTFAGCKNIEEFIIPYGAMEITCGVFSDCTELKEVFILEPEVNITHATNASPNEKPFGDPSSVVVYGFLGTETEKAVKAYGYTYKDITAYLQ